MFDYLIVGCGFSGAVSARLLAEEGKKVLVVDKRNHIGGNSYDYYDKKGILVHKYGPHIFHTNSKKVWEFLSRFTKWYLYQHKVLSYVDGKLVPMPINVDTVNELYGTNYTSDTIIDFFDKVRNKNIEVNNAKDMVITKVGEELYKKFFEGYTKKQWGIMPEELEKEVTARIPIRTNRDDRYFTNVYQGLPLYGYTNMFENMLEHENIHIMLNSDYRFIKNEISYKNLIYTGCADEFFDYKFGKLPYRSINFEFETLNEECYQRVGTINYPNDYDFTRITEFKYLTGQKSLSTTIVREYSSAEGEPYYPVPRKENEKLYLKYKKESEALENVYFLGRLGQYRYMNMDVVVDEAIKLVDRIKEKN
ncbi:UDP-galactopyranose mutase [Clostridium felsineum]|uniref:UDP-galactopyranose mutase n=1 Tax=Clostridium felsineum TaxID=36839 RepID=UPI00098CDCC3|nr:UDP-galactopyranose mutase [Clostridium felsineum]URZ00930.1 UDP-galactopyranose mutase [Clostridium felsineum]URZ16020.1 UDP-galactopyranose mutase [Clostridium felsineum DSM 794]